MHIQSLTSFALLLFTMTLACAYTAHAQDDQGGLTETQILQLRVAMFYSPQLQPIDVNVTCANIKFNKDLKERNRRRFLFGKSLWTQDQFNVQLKTLQRTMDMLKEKNDAKLWKEFKTRIVQRCRYFYGQVVNGALKVIREMRDEYAKEQQAAAANGGAADGSIVNPLEAIANAGSAAQNQTLA